jgi:hypothetical protein
VSWRRRPRGCARLREGERARATSVGSHGHWSSPCATLSRTRRTRFEANERGVARPGARFRRRAVSRHSVTVSEHPRSERYVQLIGLVGAESGPWASGYATTIRLDRLLIVRDRIQKTNCEASQILTKNRLPVTLTVTDRQCLETVSHPPGCRARLSAV